MATFWVPESHPFYGMDELSAAIAIQLLLEDGEQLLAKDKGKSREGMMSDAQMALTVYKSDLEQTSTIITDRQLTRSIGFAVKTDGNLLTELLSQEQEAGNDREAALLLGGENVPPAVRPWVAPAAEIDDELLEKLSARYVASPMEIYDTGGLAHADSDVESAQSVSTGIGGSYRHSKRRCTACQEFIDFFMVARVPCRHEYCEGCLRDLFETSMTDESLFPPRCCSQPIPSAAVRIFLTAEIVHQFEKKKFEFETKDRTYCSSPRCSAFLHIENIEGEHGTCPDCGAITCTMCKAAAHEGDCPADVNLQLILATAAENGWQRCYSCHRLVELDTGCNHMTCHCQAHFCYVCGERWKTCQCAQWDEDRLLSRAEQLVARQPRALGQWEERIVAEVNHLRTRHNCGHDQWRWVSGQHQCEECRHTLPNFIFECRQCRIQVCNRCRRNRL